MKHERNTNFADANLENTLYSLAGLMVVVGYLHAEDLRDANIGLESDNAFIRFGRQCLGTSKMMAIQGARLPGVPQSEHVLKIKREMEAGRTAGG